MNSTIIRYTGGSTGLSSYSDSQSYGLSEYSGNFTQALSMTTLHEQGRALLASNALEAIGALSAIETNLCQIAPSGAHRYKAICDSCAIAMCGIIANW